MKKLEKAGIIKILKLEGERAKYAFQLVNFDVKPDILATSATPDKKAKKGKTSQKTEKKPAEALPAPATTPEPVPAEPVVTINPS